MEMCSTPGLSGPGLPLSGVRSRLAAVTAELADIVGDLEPGLLDGGVAGELTVLFARGERLAAAGTALVARRAAECGAWRRAGERSPAEWLARRTGVASAAAAAALRTAASVEDQPEVAAAWRTGSLSTVQTGHIAVAVAADPGAAAGLVARAATDHLDVLRDRCRSVAAAARRPGDVEADRHRQVHAGRSVRTWTDRDGTGRLDARLTPDALAEVIAALAPFADAVFQEARKAGARESFDCYRADALVDLARAATTPLPDTPPARAGGAARRSRGARRPPATIIVRVDHAALRRGHVEPGEICEIDGTGPVPVAVARHLAVDAFLAAVILDDHQNIHDVVHLGRNVTARQHTALVARDRHCVVPGCHGSNNLEMDHVTGWTVTHRTCLDDLARLCKQHHHLKTREHWQLHGPPGQWTWTPPNTPPPNKQPPDRPRPVAPPDPYDADRPPGASGSPPPTVNPLPGIAEGGSTEPNVAIGPTPVIEPSLAIGPNPAIGTAPTVKAGSARQPDTPCELPLFD